VMISREPKSFGGLYLRPFGETRWREVMRSVPKQLATSIAAFMKKAFMKPLVFDATLVIVLVGYVLLLRAIVERPL
jgi:hypothetical protein